MKWRRRIIMNNDEIMIMKMKWKWRKWKVNNGVKWNNNEIMKIIIMKMKWNGNERRNDNDGIIMKEMKENNEMK